MAEVKINKQQAIAKKGNTRFNRALQTRVSVQPVF